MTWKPKKESISRRKEWSLAMSGTEMSAVSSGLGTGRSLMISASIFSPDRDRLRNEWERGNGENKLTTLGDFYYELEKSHGIVSGALGIKGSY